MSVPAGWYDDGSGRQRWWDGQQWTEHFAPETAAPAADAAPAEATDAPADGFDPDQTVLREEVPAANDATDAGQDAVTEIVPDATPADAGNADVPPYAAPVADAGAYTPPAADAYQAPSYPGAESTQQTQQYTAPYGAAPYGGAPTEPAGPKKTPILGYVGLGLAVLGTILAVIPVTFGIGAFILFAALVVSIIALFQKNTAKWPGIVGLILSIVGGIIGVIVLALTMFTTLAQTVDELPDRPSPVETMETDEPAETETDAPSDSSGRPTVEEVKVGLENIVASTGVESFSDEQMQCYAEYFVASDISDEDLRTIAEVEDALTDLDAASEFTEKFTEGTSTCLVP